VAHLRDGAGNDHGIFSRGFWQDEFTPDEEEDDEDGLPWAGDSRGSGSEGQEARERIAGA
jgi:hypothetical protein